MLEWQKTQSPGEVMAAGDSKRAQILEALLESHAEVNVKNVAGRTALVYAITAGLPQYRHDESLRPIEILLEHGADPNVKVSGTGGMTPLILNAQRSMSSSSLS
jgi:ankyrin repeat protein